MRQRPNDIDRNTVRRSPWRNGLAPDLPYWNHRTFHGASDKRSPGRLLKKGRWRRVSWHDSLRQATSLRHVMRGLDERTGPRLSHIDLEARMRRDHPPGLIRQIANAALVGLSGTSRRSIRRGWGALPYRRNGCCLRPGPRPRASALGTARTTITMVWVAVYNLIRPSKLLAAPARASWAVGLSSGRPTTPRIIRT